MCVGVVVYNYNNNYYYYFFGYVIHARSFLMVS